MNYVWETLGGTGTHENMVYGENERHEIRAQFGHIPQRVLDIGCAGGGVGFGLKRDYNSFVWGVELNKASAAHAATRLDKVSTVALEAFSDEEIALLKTIDTVCLLDVLEHMYHPWSVLAFLAKHLPAHAQVIISLPNIANRNIMRDLAAGYWNYKSWGLLDITHIRFFTPYEMDKMLCETGYTIQSVDFSYLGVDPEQMAELTPDSEYPVWKIFDDVQIRVRNYEHWQHLHMVQMLFRAQITPNNILTPEQHAKRFEPHPPTTAF
jgi:2-polyprenyl-3-methyl-5-hydroxy-6-metoxy-1,4-benzoquinol methylase